MGSAPWKQPGPLGASLLVAGLSYHLARDPLADHPPGVTFGTRQDPTEKALPDDNASLLHATKLSDRRSRGETAEQIAKDVKRALGHSFEMFTPDGRINVTLLEMAGIPSDRRDAVQKAFDGSIESASASLRRRMVPDDEKTFPEKRVHAYRIPADPAEANRLLDELDRALVSACGETATAILTEVYAPEYRFAGFGRYDVSLKREPTIGVSSQAGLPDVEFDTGKFGYQFVVTEPGSAKPIAQMSFAEGYEKKHFGNLLEPPPWK